MGFPKQEYCSRLPFPILWDLPDPGIEPVIHALQADSLPLSHWGSQAGIIMWQSNSRYMPTRNIFISLSTNNGIKTKIDKLEVIL